MEFLLFTAREHQLLVLFMYSCFAILLLYFVYSATTFSYLHVSERYPICYKPFIIGHKLVS